MATASLTKSAQGYISSLFCSEERADCNVRFYAAPDRHLPEDGGERTWLCDALPGHTLVLAPNSARLRAQLDGWQQQQQQQQDGVKQEDGEPGDEPPAKRSRAGQLQHGCGRGRPLLAMPLEGEHELLPALEVLCFCYTARLQATGMADLLLVYKLAQDLLADECKDACCAALLAADPPTAASAVHLLTAPAFAMAMRDERLRPAVAKCWPLALQAYAAAPTAAGSLLAADRSALLDALLTRLGSTLRVARSEELTAAWLALPVEALEALLAEDRLPVDCEETVLVLLQRWAQAHHPVPAQLATRLRRLVRPLALGPAYLQHVLPKLPWFALQPSEATDLLFAGLSASKLAAKGLTAAAVEEPLAVVLPAFAAHPEWLGARHSSDCGSRQVKVDWQVPRAKLEEMLARARAKRGKRLARGHGDDGVRTELADLVSPAYQYLGGFEWSMSLSVDMTAAGTAAGGRPVEGVLYVSCHLPPCFRALVGTVVTAVMFDATLVATVGGVAVRTQSWRHKYVEAGRDGTGISGDPAFFMEDGALEVAGWERYMGGAGRMELSATISGL